MSAVSLNLSRQGYPDVDPDLSAEHAYAYRDLARHVRVTPWHECPAVGCTRTGDIHDRFCDPCWCELPVALRRRLRLAAAAVDLCPNDATVAAIYQARFAEAVAYLGSGTQVAR